MRKYWQIARVSLAQYLVYRLSFILWRVRVILNLLLIYFLWTSVYTGRAEVFNYSQEQIITYILLIYLIGDIVYSSRAGDLAGQIRSGQIINYLLRPFSVLKQVFARETVDKLLNIGFSILEIGLFILIVQPIFFIQTEPSAYLFAAIATFFGIVSAFFIFLSLSFIAFWSTEIWAPRFLFFVLVGTLAGNYYPIDILPTPMYYLLLLTPFPYFAYLPTKIYLDGISLNYLLMLLISVFWAFLAFKIAQRLWRKGIKEFSFFGR